MITWELDVDNELIKINLSYSELIKILLLTKEYVFKKNLQPYPCFGDVD